MEKHINKKFIIAISLATIMIFVGFTGLGHNFSNNNYKYNVNSNENISLSLIGNNVYINSFNHLSPIKISIYQINNGTLRHLNFNMTNIVFNKNSLYIFDNNSEMKLTLMFILKNNKIYMYNIFKNNINKNISFIDLISIKTANHSILKNNNTKDNTTLISSCNVNINNLNINWMSDKSIFHYGLIYKNNYNNIELPFGPINLYKNYTYSIHPIIIYNNVISNSISPDRLPVEEDTAFEYPPASLTCYVYNSNGKEIGTYTLASDACTDYKDKTIYSPGVAMHLEFATGASYPDADGMWETKQTISYGGNELNCGGGFLKVIHVHVGNQNSADNTLIHYIAQYLLDAVSAAVGFTIPNPLTFISKASDNPCNTNPYSYTIKGEIVPVGYFVNEYCPIWQSTNILNNEYGKKSYMFGIDAGIEFGLGNLPSHTVNAYFVDYSVQATFESGYIGCPDYYTGPCSTLVTGINMCYT